jgi:glycosyltransferase involved in cell wall biosynthesis
LSVDIHAINMPPESVRRLKVLQIVDTLSMGGAETWIMELLRFWHRQGGKAPQLDILATSGNQGIFDEEARALGAKVFYLCYTRKNLRAFVRSFRRILRDGAYDAVHDHQDYSSGIHFLWGLGRLPHVRVAHVHNPWQHIEINYGTSFSRRLTTRAGRFLVRQLATHVCGTSPDILRQYGFFLQTLTPPLTTALHCGFDVGRFNAPIEPDRSAVLSEFGWDETARIVLFAGRLDRALEYEHPQNHKNSWLALNVVRAAAEKDKSVCLLMAGDGVPQRLEMQRRVESWGLSDRIRLLGVREDMPRLMRAANMLFFPSNQEGLGMVAVEAQAAGLPVLASDAVPAAAIVVPQLYRALPARSLLADWTDALFATLNAPRVALDVARRAVEASDFSIETSASRLLRIYGSGVH